MVKIVIFLSGKEEAKLKELSRLMARDLQTQARITLVNQLNLLQLDSEKKDDRKPAAAN